MKKNRNVIKITERQLKSVIEKIISEQVEPSQEKPVEPSQEDSDVTYYGISKELGAVLNKLNKTITMKRYPVFKEPQGGALIMGQETPLFEITPSSFWPRPYKNAVLPNFLWGWAHIDVVNKKGKQKDAVMLLQYDCGTPNKGFSLNVTDDMSAHYMKPFEKTPNNSYFSPELSDAIQQNYCKYVPKQDILKRN